MPKRNIQFPTSIRVYIVDVLREWNRLDEAHELAMSALHSVRQTEGLVFRDQAYRALTRVHLSRGMLAAEEAMVSETRQQNHTLESACPAAIRLSPSVPISEPMS